MLSNVRGLIACCFPTINYYLQLMENLPPDLFIHLTPVSYTHAGWKQQGSLELSKIHTNGHVLRKQ